MKIFPILVAALSISVMFSCSKSTDSEDIMTQGTESVSPAELNVLPSSPNVALGDIGFIAKTDKGALTRNGNAKAVQEIVPILSDSGTPLMYAVNYAGGGYRIFSATHNYEPLISESESGRYIAGENPGLEIMLATTKAVIEHQMSESADSTLMTTGRLEWLKYSKTKKYTPERTRSNDDVYRLIDINLGQWRAAGYDIYMLRDFLDYNNWSFPQDLKDQADFQSQIYACRSYDRMTHAFVLVKNSYVVESKAPLLRTAWDQDEPFNTYVPTDIFGVKHKAGCVNVAVGQIMAYHRYPLKYPWSSILEYNSYSQSPSSMSAIGFLFRDIYDATRSFPALTSVATSATDEGARDAFVGFGYTYGNFMGYNFGYIAASLKFNRPVYISGMKPGIFNFDGHAWVCDGYEERANNNKVILQVLEDSPYTPQNFYPITLREGADYYTYKVHMNWGWGYDYNTWYVDLILPNGFDYSRDMKIITHIRPNI